MQQICVLEFFRPGLGAAPPVQRCRAVWRLTKHSSAGKQARLVDKRRHLHRVVPTRALRLYIT